MERMPKSVVNNRITRCLGCAGIYEKWKGSSMTRIVVDENLEAKLRNQHDEIELCDASGKVLGRFIPVIDMSEWEPVTPDASDDELDQRAQSSKWHTTQEVIARLRSLEQR